MKQHCKKDDNYTLCGMPIWANDTHNHEQAEFLALPPEKRKCQRCSLTLSRSRGAAPAPARPNDGPSAYQDASPRIRAVWW